MKTLFIAALSSSLLSACLGIDTAPAPTPPPAPALAPVELTLDDAYPALERAGLNVADFHHLVDLSTQPNAPLTNCRINTFTLAGQHMTATPPTTGDPAMLFFDHESIAAGHLFDDQQLAAFDAWYSHIPTTADAADYTGHRRTVTDWLRNSHAAFPATAQVINVYIHDNLASPATMFIGHTGIFGPDGDSWLFVEKLAFDQPYRVTRLAGLPELESYLRAAYDDGDGMEYGRPVITANDQVLETAL